MCVFSASNPNLALNQNVFQISTHGTEYAEIAVDGLIGNERFSHTNGGEYTAYLQWWIVDLEKDYRISEKSVYGRSSQGEF